jgi:hypothetical protein
MPQKLYHSYMKMGGLKAYEMLIENVDKLENSKNKKRIFAFAKSIF